MSKVYAVITEYLLSGCEPSCELFESEQDAREYVLDSIVRDITESDRYDGPSIWKDEVLSACDKARASECKDTEYQFAVECFNSFGVPFEMHWIFGRTVNPLCFLDCIPTSTRGDAIQRI